MEDVSPSEDSNEASFSWSLGTSLSILLSSVSQSVIISAAIAGVYKRRHLDIGEEEGSMEE